MKIFVANWKMNNSFDEADVWLEGFFKNYISKYDQLKNIELVLCPAAVVLDYINGELTDEEFKNLEEIMKSQKTKLEDFSPEELSEILIKQRPLKLGGQDCHYQKNGAFTGDISAEMLVKVGCQYVILGHCERRTNYFESSEVVAKKVAAALDQRLIPIICVGESKEIRDLGKHLEFVYHQIIDSLPKDGQFEKIIIAYEPIWSIGTGIIPSLSQISEMAKFIKKIFNEKLPNRAKQHFLLYGGSTNQNNAQEILSIEGIDGLLVGKSSLDVDEFIKICLS